MGRLIQALFAALVICAATPQALHAQWPTRYVRMIVPASAGSAPDVICRLIADRLSQRWGQQVVIENQPGAGGNTGVASAARAAPDGYALLFSQAAPLALNQHLFKRLPFDVMRDFDPITLVGISPMIIAAAPKLGVKTLADLIARAKAEPGKLSFATSGAKNVPHLTGELLKSLAGIQLVQIPYRTSPQAVADTMTGVVDLMIDGIPLLQPQVQAGSLTPLAVSAAKRLPGLEQVPAASETVPGFDVAGWFALLAPKGVAPEIIARVNSDTIAILRQEDIVARLRDVGVYPDPDNRSPGQLGAFMQRESELFGKIVRSAGIESE
jgi:tripartite-type tricarboxylate transporter receptor subunit TctC